MTDGADPAGSPEDALDNFDKLVGVNVQHYRSAAGMSQADLAARLSESGERIHQQTILKIEKGARPLKFSEAIRVAHELGVPVTRLLGSETDAKTNADFISQAGKLSRTARLLEEIAEGLANELVFSAVLIGRIKDPEWPQPSDQYRARLAAYLVIDWAAIFDANLKKAVTDHGFVQSVLPDFVGGSYRDTLDRLTYIVTRPTADDAESDFETELHKSIERRRGLSDASET
ncbi:XRE family transcriptional regulator [Mycobacteroides abscessus]|uniref:helix-turn-helix transcriptional regulator n=1 Tax=Mycobacteroides abscessus TaxID=36809 RepID=UPI000C26193E|nr:helix-turn-helix transcriptional regulator [Mycobacteroides abscessus]PVB45679.1 XRE family transcriptional regulator [Mycobacteroides abscessus]RIR72602.1 XRE family transcriptional regulator [Mycobacteroides abscessus]